MGYQVKVLVMILFVFHRQGREVVERQRKTYGFLHEAPEVFDSGEIILRVQRPGTLMQPDNGPIHTYSA